MIRVCTNQSKAHLQAELQQERVKTWRQEASSVSLSCAKCRLALRQSTDVVMAFAGGKETSEWGGEDIKPLNMRGRWEGA